MQKPIGGRRKTSKKGRSVLAVFSAINDAAFLLYIEGRGVTAEQASLFQHGTNLTINKGAIDTREH